MYYSNTIIDGESTNRRHRHLHPANVCRFCIRELEKTIITPVHRKGTLSTVLTTGMLHVLLRKFLSMLLPIRFMNTYNKTQLTMPDFTRGRSTGTSLLESLRWLEYTIYLRDKRHDICVHGLHRCICRREETARCRNCCLWFKVRRQHSLQAKLRKPGFRSSSKRTGAKQNLTQNGHSRSRVLESVAKR